MSQMEGLRLEVAFDVRRPTASDMNRRTAKEREGRRSVSIARNPLDPFQVHEFRTARSDESGPEPLFEVREGVVGEKIVIVDSCAHGALFGSEQ